MAAQKDPLSAAGCRYYSVATTVPLLQCRYCNNEAARAPVRTKMALRE
jgi:hypothetical protein